MNRWERHHTIINYWTGSNVITTINYWTGSNVITTINYWTGKNVITTIVNYWTGRNVIIIIVNYWTGKNVITTTVNYGTGRNVIIIIVNYWTGRKVIIIIVNYWTMKNVITTIKLLNKVRTSHSISTGNSFNATISTALYSSYILRHCGISAPVRENTHKRLAELTSTLPDSEAHFRMSQNYTSEPRYGTICIKYEYTWCNRF